MLNLPRSGTSARTSSYGWRIFVLAVCMTQIVACIRQPEYESIEGVQFVSPLGRPPAQTVLWSPHDTRRLLVESSTAGFGPARIYLLDISSGRQRVVAETSHGGFAAAAWAPDGRELILSVEPGTEGYESAGSWIVNLESGVKTPLNVHGYSAWSPDGHRIAYLKFIRTAGTGPRGIELHLLDLASRQDDLLHTDNDVYWFFGLSWSPDARSLAFAKGDGRANDVYVFDVEARKLIAITDDSSNVYPAWSPAANMIAYERMFRDSSGPGSAIHLVNSDGTCDTELPGLRRVHSPTWSPDGRQLAFIGPDGIYVADLEVLLGRDLSKGLCP